MHGSFLTEHFMTWILCFLVDKKLTVILKNRTVHVIVKNTAISKGTAIAAEVFMLSFCTERV